MSYFEQFTTLDDLKLSTSDTFYSMKEKFNILKETLQNHNEIDNRINNNQLQLVDNSGLKLRFNNVDNISLPSDRVVWDNSITINEQETDPAVTYVHLDGSSVKYGDEIINLFISKKLIWEEMNGEWESRYSIIIFRQASSDNPLPYYFDIKNLPSGNSDQFAKIYTNLIENTIYIWFEYIQASSNTVILHYNECDITNFIPVVKFTLDSTPSTQYVINIQYIESNKIMYNSDLFCISKNSSDPTPYTIKYSGNSTTSVVTRLSKSFESNYIKLNALSSSSLIIIDDIIYTILEYQNNINLITFNISELDNANISDIENYNLIDGNFRFNISAYKQYDNTFNCNMIDLTNKMIYNIVFNIVDNTYIIEMIFNIKDRSYQFNMLLDEDLDQVKWKFKYSESENILYYSIYNAIDRILVIEFDLNWKMLNHYYMNTNMNYTNNISDISSQSHLITFTPYNLSYISEQFEVTPGGDVEDVNVRIFRQLNLDNNIKFDLDLNSISAVESYNIINYNMRDSIISQTNISTYSGTNSQNYTSNKHMYKKSCSYFFKKNQFIKKDVYDNELAFNYSLTHHENNKL